MQHYSTIPNDNGEYNMRIIVFSIFIAVSLFGYFLEYLTYSRFGDPIPENVKDIFDEAGYKKNQSYLMTNSKFSVVSSSVGLLFTFVILALNFHSFLFNYISSFTDSFYITNIFILLVPQAIIAIMDTVFDVYDTFVIEERFGFNNTTVKTFVADFFKEQALELAIGIGIILLFLFMYQRLGNSVFFVFFFVIVAFILFMAFISPFLIRIFNKLTPIEDGELKNKIEGLMEKSGYKIKGIYMVDASRRSTELNAFATGFGKTKTIGLYDTLKDKMTDDEIVSILAHEIGHIKKHHVLKSTSLAVLFTSFGFFTAYFIITLPEISLAFGFDEVNIVFGLMIMMILISPIVLLLKIPMNAMSRKHEYEADRFEKEMMGKEIPISALKKLYREDLGNLTPHPFVVMLNHSHPTASQRVAAFESDTNNTGT